MRTTPTSPPTQVGSSATSGSAGTSTSRTCSAMALGLRSYWAASSSSAIGNSPGRVVGEVVAGEGAHAVDHLGLEPGRPLHLAVDDGLGRGVPRPVAVEPRTLDLGAGGVLGELGLAGHHRAHLRRRAVLAVAHREPGRVEAAVAGRGGRGSSWGRSWWPLVVVVALVARPHRLHRRRTGGGRRGGRASFSSGLQRVV